MVKVELNLLLCALILVKSGCFTDRETLQTTPCILAGVRVTSIAKFYSEILKYDKKKAATGENTSYGKRSEDPRREPVGTNLVQRGILAHASTRQAEIDIP